MLYPSSFIQFARAQTLHPLINQSYAACLLHKLSLIFLVGFHSFWASYQQFKLSFPIYFFIEIVGHRYQFSFSAQILIDLHMNYLLYIYTHPLSCLILAWLKTSADHAQFEFCFLVEKRTENTTVYATFILMVLSLLFTIIHHLSWHR